MNGIAEIFERYEAVRHRLPQAAFPAATREVNSLRDVDGIDAFVFDAFGVLNVGETPIPGAAERLDELRARGCAIRILSNAASYGHAAAVRKFRALGMAISEEEVITSRMAALAGLSAGTWGCVAAPGDDLGDVPHPRVRLNDDPAAVPGTDGVLFLSSKGWSAAQQQALTAALRETPRPVVIANADLVAPREGGFSLEPGHFGHLLADAGVADVRFFGKPFAEVYAMIETTLPGVAPGRIAMCGDTLHTDILGAAARGWRTVLVTRDGLFAGAEAGAYCAASGIRPDWSLPRI